MQQSYWCESKEIERVLNARKTLLGPVKSWKCPCGEGDCRAYVLYARDRNSQTGEEGFCFMATQTFDPEHRLTFHIDNVEDFNEFVADERVNETDRIMYAIWFDRGLREAILNA